MHDTKVCGIARLAMMVLFFASLCTIVVNAAYYSDPASGIRFDIPEGWREVSIDDEYKDLRYKINYYDDTAGVTYWFIDLWAELNNEAANDLTEDGYSSSDINNENLSAQEISAITGYDTNEIITARYGEHKYYYVNTTDSVALKDTFVTIKTDITQAFLLENGILHVFTYSCQGEKDLHSDFEELLSSVVLPKTISGLNTVTFVLLVVLLSFVLNFLTIMVPILIYRYGVRKKPLDEAKAKIVIIAYSVIHYIIVIVLCKIRLGYVPFKIVGAVDLWMCIANYAILISGRGNYERSS